MSQRLGGLGIMLASGVILSLALWLEKSAHLQPCNLCILQRLAYIGCAIGGVLWWILPVKTASRYLGRGCVLLFSGVGFALALRQVWLQHLPKSQVPACGPGFQYLVDNFPMKEALPLLLQGDGNCAVVDWRFLHLSMAQWSAIAFAAFLLFTLYALFKK